MTRQLKVIIDKMPVARSCGTCNLCCTTHGIEELAKPRNVRCGNLNTLGRCGVYENRPLSCRTYQCLWLQGQLPYEMKPVISRVVADANTEGNMLVLHVLPQDREVLRKGRVRDFISLVMKQLPVVVVCGTDRTVYAGPGVDIVLNEYNVETDGNVRFDEDIPFTKKTNV